MSHLSGNATNQELAPIGRVFSELGPIGQPQTAVFLDYVQRNQPHAKSKANKVQRDGGAD